LRENGGDMRQELFKMYETNIAENGFTYKTITGSGSDRLKNAIKAVREYL
jgi:hypothetical protein